MKKIFISALLLLFCFSAFANEDKPKKKAEAKKQLRLQARPNVPGTFLIQVGFNALRNSSESFEIGSFGSKTVNLQYLYDIRLFNGKFFLMPGIGLGLEKYKFDNGVTLEYDDNDVDFVDLESAVPDAESFNKSNLAANYLDLPVELMFATNPNDLHRSFKVAVGFKAGVLYSAHTKIKYKEDGETKKIKNKQRFNLNDFRYGISGRIGVGSMSIFYYQSLTNLFQDGDGPEETEAATFTVGISIAGF